MCGRFATGEATKALSQYLDMVSILFKCHLCFEWALESVQNLGSEIRFFDQRGIISFGRYQVSAMPTQKLHGLDHLCEALPHMLAELTVSILGYTRYHTEVFNHFTTTALGQEEQKWSRWYPCRMWRAQNRKRILLNASSQKNL